MSRAIKLIGETGSASAGLSTSDVTSLISSKGEWEFVAKYEIASMVSTFTIDGFDMNVYRGYKIIYENFDPQSSVNPHFRVKKSSGDFVNNNSYVVHRHQTSYSANSSSSNSNVWWNPQNTFGSGGDDRMQAEVEIYQSDNDRYYGYHKISQKLEGGYYDTHTEGNFIGYRGSNSDNVTGIAVQDNWASGTAYLYRTAKRA
jgi:ABC-type dipeptide/oligopeptide/nickel transport system ATPase component